MARYELEEIPFPDGMDENPPSHTITVTWLFNEKMPPILAPGTVLDLDDRGMWAISTSIYKPAPKEGIGYDARAWYGS